DPRLVVCVSPEEGPVSSQAVVDAFLDAIGPGDATESLMVKMWRQANIMGVKRGRPQATGPGKILHLRVEGALPGSPE
ncbi:hypothetical protein ACFL0Q_08360, partial [Thermodesulfobacteriota bacterium]